MCFSPQADVMVGALIGAVGVDCLRHARSGAQIPLAVLPLVFAAHQVLDAFVWWGLQGRVPADVGHRAAWLYLVIAFGLLPVLVPAAVGALEPAARRGRMALLTAVGALVAAILTYAVVRGPITATIKGHYIVYRADLWHGGTLVALYVLVTCGSLLLSAYPHVRAYGAVNLVVVVLLAWVNQVGFISLWCLWAAVTSVCIAVHLRYVHHEPQARSPRAVTHAV